MIPGAPNAARWVRPAPRRALPLPLLERMVHAAFPRCRVVNAQPFPDGLRNANFKIQLDSTPELVVLRIYEHDASLCQKEVDLIRLIGHSVPVPEVIHAEPCGLEELPPFALMSYIQGISFHQLKRSGSADAIAQAAYSAGETLAAIGRIRFPKAGWLAPGPSVTEPLLQGANVLPRFVDRCLESRNLQQRMPEDLRDRAHALLWSWAAQLASLDDETCLVHCDFGKRNLLVQRELVRQGEGRWRVAGVLDWEFAVSDSPLIDLGHFLRYERAARPLLEPHFSTGFLAAGGTLPQEWQKLARLFDLSALCESLTHDELPDAIVAELLELVQATVEDRDPQWE